ncbi:MAG: dienelactone hydrolase family protein [Elusimicrobia bacterium]|nr:dienelactone hydrolase family protein [Elusimicrobiota bacterium]
MLRLLALCALTLCAVSSQAALKTQEVEYKDEETVLQGYFAWDDSYKGKRPGVLVVHDLWGHGPYARRRAEELAKLGYLAFANDMYGKGKSVKSHAEARAVMAPVRGDRALMRRRAMVAVEVLRKNPLADPAKTAAIGYCFGGTTVLELARMGADLKGVASFHGGLDTPTPAQPGAVKAKVLVLHGADDGHVNPSVPAFQEELRAAKADWQFVSYGGAVHSFTVKEAGDDPSKGSAYNAEADRRSWAAMKAFFEEVLR